jgi:dihydrolipoamide dehydrogenase
MNLENNAMADFDLIVIGAGPAGYVGAIYAAQNGLKVGLVEKNPTLGGTCLNIGCIPTKALLFSAMHFDKVKKLGSYGVKIRGIEEEGAVELDFAQVNKRKADIVKNLTSGIAFLMKKNKVEVLKGHGRLLNANTVEVTDAAGNKTQHGTKNVLLATGSRVRSFPTMPIDGKDVISSDHALFLDKVPHSMAVIGGGVIGCEMASCYGRFGTQVSIFELAEQILPMEDSDAAAELAKALKKQNCEIFTGVRIAKVEPKNGQAEVWIEGEAAPRVFEKVLVSVGRAPVTDDVGLEKVGIAVGKGGFLDVDMDSYRTSVKNIFAVGDIIPTPQLAHTASAEAMFAVDVILGKKRTRINYSANPGAVYTYPELASVGAREQELKNAGRDYKVGKFPFMAIGKARIDDATDGFVKILTCAKTGEVLGAHFVHAKATELVAGMSLGINLEMTIEDIAHTIHPHPTISEAVMEAAHAAMGHAIHL